MRIVYWFSVAGLMVGIVQIYYWLFVTHAFFPLTLQGGYAILAFGLGTFCVIAGALSRRRAFAIATLVATAFHPCALVFFSIQAWSGLFPEFVAGRISWFDEMRASADLIAWNSFAVVGHLLVCYYLLRYEFRLLASQAA